MTRPAAAATGLMLALVAAAVVAWVLRSGGGKQPASVGEAAAGLPGFQGSARCMQCHLTQHREWEGSLHARTIRKPSQADADMLGRALLCEQDQAAFVLGEKHSRRFMVPSPSEPGRHVLLPCRYDVGPGEWVGLHEADWTTLTWEKGCGACHSVGFSSDTLTMKEMGVGCESCHGPDSRHGTHTSGAGMTAFKKSSAREEITICASCHLQGGRSSSTGLNFARNYEPGDDLFADYQFEWAALDSPATPVDNPIDVHQKLLIRAAVTAQSQGYEGLRCTSCHEFHRMGHGKHEKLARQEFCHLCHEAADFKLKEYNQSCNVCEF